VPLTPTQVVAWLFEQVPGTARLLGGVDSARLLDWLDDAPQIAGRRRILLVHPTPAATIEQCLDQALEAVARAAGALWPAVLAAAETAPSVPGLPRPWLRAAAHSLAAGHMPRVPGTPPATELAQLTRILEYSGGVTLAVALDGDAWPAAVTVRTLEWLAAHGPLAVIALRTALPANAPPFDRLWPGARTVATAPPASPPSPATTGPWLVPWQGSPHPLSATEQLLAQRLAADPELAPLFGFNLPVTTRAGRCYRVDLLWAAGRLVVELDGYPDHARFDKFLTDRQRDYELLLTDYCVLRLANVEIAQDLGLAVEKIRAAVRWRRARLGRDRDVSDLSGGQNA